MKKKLPIDRKKLCLLVVGGALLLAGVTQSQAARNFLGWSSAASQKQDETPTKGREQRKVAPLAPVPAKTTAPQEDEMRAARERAQLNRTPTSRANLMDLVAESEIILRGHITEVRDGLPQQGLPYTQVNLRVIEVIRGDVGSEFSFRQFGLLKPRRVHPKREMISLTPAGWATYKEGEDVILFLHAAASLTGLRAPIGLAQGKFVVDAGNVVSQANNHELFADMEAPESLMPENERTVLRAEQGPANAEAFLSLVRRAVSENWVERGFMRHVQK